MKLTDFIGLYGNQNSILRFKFVLSAIRHDRQKRPLSIDNTETARASRIIRPRRRGDQLFRRNVKSTAELKKGTAAVFLRLFVPYTLYGVHKTRTPNPSEAAAPTWKPRAPAVRSCAGADRRLRPRSYVVPLSLRVVDERPAIAYFWGSPCR
ncbi:hypothetical protein EVAR_34020_1 [Eumeta japonica]|uniref:Uncharacterized protein n=1 Tax=Eumeta variegata TaxID=151549 RepID=A0A4C1VTD5_EUMVA|nr:hypothetical protein EVAR_34020_1 [Eumeta japonica]